MVDGSPFLSFVSRFSSGKRIRNLARFFLIFFAHRIKEIFNVLSWIVGTISGTTCRRASGRLKYH